MPNNISNVNTAKTNQYSLSSGASPIWISGLKWLAAYWIVALSIRLTMLLFVGK